MAALGVGPGAAAEPGLVFLETASQRAAGDAACSPASPDCLESLVELCLAASELFQHRKGVIAYRGGSDFFFNFFSECVLGEEVQLWAALQEGDAESRLTQQSY